MILNELKQALQIQEDHAPDQLHIDAIHYRECP